MSAKMCLWTYRPMYQPRYRPSDGRHISRLSADYMQVAVKYRRNVGSLSIDMSADNRTTTLGRHIDRHIGRVSVDISTDAQPICQPIYRATHLGRHIDPHSTDIATDISVNTRPICRPIRRSTVDRHVG